jgi:hypothetical protein
MKQSKRQKRLDRRIRGYEEIMKSNISNPQAYKKPGSLRK